MAYNVSIDVFEGPFDLLLHLVRINEMDIYDIQVAEITQQYLDFIKEMGKLDLEVAGDFLVMAATLINLKSRTLMPPVGPEEEEEEEVDEEYESIRSAQDLMERLIEYRQFKEVASKLSNNEEEQMRLFFRNRVMPALTDRQKDLDEPDELREDISLLFSAFSRVLQFAENRVSHHILEEQFSTEELIENIRTRLERQRRIRISDLFEKCLNKQEMITTFLALLELCKMRQARVRQRKNYGDIELISASEPEDDEEE
jgi:segregation and condensation protein A